MKCTDLTLFIFFTVPSLVWQAALKKNKVKLDLIADIDMLLKVEKVIRGGICNVIYQYAKVNEKDYEIFSIGM